MLVRVAFFLFIISILLIFIQKAHFLRVLLVIELITLSLFFISLRVMGRGTRFCGCRFALVFLVFGVYEAANGLGLLVSRTRSRGIDQLRGLFALRF